MMVMIPEFAFEWIIPEMIVMGCALLILLLEAFSGERDVRSHSRFLALAGSVAALYFTAAGWGHTAGIFNNLYLIDNYGTFFKALFLVISILICLGSQRYLERHAIVMGEYYALLLFGVLGMMVMVSSSSFITIFIGLELMSISIYVLCGLLRENHLSVESSFKYFLIGAFATAFLLYGMALLYAATGVLDLYELRDYLGSGEFFLTPTFMAGLAFLTVGLGFKTALVPFHMWTPDVYEGAPTPVTAYMATGVKAAAFAVLARMIFIPFDIQTALPYWRELFWLLAVLTMIVGNITALVQDGVKRMLAYSSIAHAGYLLIAFTVGNIQALEAMLFYLLVYAFMNIGAFTLLMVLEKKEGSPLTCEDFSGLAKRNPFLALAMTIFLLSLTGIPPMAGFMGKLYLFGMAIRAEYYWLAVIGVLNSVLAAYYYLRLVMFMYFKDPLQEGRVISSAGPFAVIIIAVAVTIYLGIFPRTIINLIGYAGFAPF